MTPIAIDLFCGLGGWTEGLLAEGYRVIGFDIERHCYGDARYPAQLVLHDVLTLHGAQFKDVALIVASPPCQAYSYRAMPHAKPPPRTSRKSHCRSPAISRGRGIPIMPEDTALLALIERYKPKPKRKRDTNDGGLVPDLLKLVAFKPTVKLYRNNVGCLQDKHGRYVTYGLCVGSSDLIGYRSLVITQAMVGQRIAQFVAVEAKRPKSAGRSAGVETDRQTQFLDQCRAAGALAVCVRSVDELDEALR